MKSAKANLTKFTQMLQTGGNGRAATITSLATPARKQKPIQFDSRIKVSLGLAYTSQAGKRWP